MSTPRVTVVTPTFNAASTIARCIHSVRSQTQAEVEHLVVDGGSRDGTVAEVQRSGVRYISEPDAGIYDAMSKGVRAAQGEYVHILNADDAYASPGALAEAIAALDSGGSDVCHGKAAHVDELGRVVRVFGRDVPRAGLLRKMRIAHPTVVVRRSVYERFGTFSVGFRIAADHEFLLRIWGRVRIVYIPKVLVHMQIGGASTDSANVVRAYRESMAAALLHGANPALALARCWYEIAKHKLVFTRRYRIQTHADPASA
jgi:glycosyltransferase involved in cell wall biosynthesis